MKLSEVAKRLEIDSVELEKLVLKHPEIKTSGMFNISIDDSDEQKVVTLWRQANPTKEEIAIRTKKKNETNNALSSMLISSGFSFEGYRITKYSGYISGDDVIEIPRKGLFGNNNGQSLSDALVKIRINALKELKQAAYDLGCNAVIGVDFDYLTLEPESTNIVTGHTLEPYVVCVTANGNAVVVEKIEE